MSNVPTCECEDCGVQVARSNVYSLRQLDYNCLCPTCYENHMESNPILEQYPD